MSSVCSSNWRRRRTSAASFPDSCSKLWTTHRKRCVTPSLLCPNHFFGGGTDASLCFGFEVIFQITDYTDLLGRNSEIEPNIQQLNKTFPSCLVLNIYFVLELRLGFCKIRLLQRLDAWCRHFILNLNCQHFNTSLHFLSLLILGM